MKKNKLVLMASVIIFVTSIFLGNAQGFGFCDDNSLDCIEMFSESLAQPLFLGSMSIIIVSFILIFLKPEIFKIWSKFALFAIPLLAIFIITTPVRCSAALGMCLNKELASWLSSIVFLIISLVIIIYKSLKPRSQII